MKALAAAALGMMFAIASASASDQTWTGEISDEMCGAQHEAPAEGGAELTHRDCTLACVRGGSKFVLATEEKVYGIVDQTDPELETYAGAKVTITGELSGDAITIKKIEPAKP
jgi:hypothetical protein